MKFRRLCLCLCGAFLLSNCINYTVATDIQTLRLLRDKYPTLNVRNDWESYGAYYEIDELFIEAPYEQFIDPFITGTSYSTAVRKYVVSNRIRILTQEGVRFGTVRIPRYNGSIAVFKPRMFDEKGNQRSLNRDAMEAEFRKTAVVVFPNVTPGCVLETYIVINSPTPLSAYEYWFSRAIPVYKAKFTFSFPDKFEYAFKEYGHCPPALSARSPDNDHFSQRTWSIEDVLPNGRGNYLPKADVTEDRVALSMKYAFNHPVYSSWSTLADNINRHYFETAFSPDIINSTVDSLVRGLPSRFEKADKIVSWVQDNISLAKEETNRPFNPAGGFQKRQASVWEKATICNKMLSIAGITSELLLTRPHPLGGFDESFVTPVSLHIPLVMVTINDTSRLAFPYSRGYALGEYPETYFGLKGVLLNTERVCALPEPNLDQSNCNYNFALEYSHDTLFNTLDLEYTGPIASKLRSRMLLQQSSEIKEGFQHMITLFDHSNKLSKCLVFNLNDRGAALRAKITFFNQDQITVRKGVTHIGLSHLFYAYADQPDSTASTPFNFDGKMTIRETVLFKKNTGAATTLNLSCAPINNPLFSSYCISSETPEYSKMCRTITVHRNVISPEQTASFSEEIKALLRIKESSILIK